MENAAIKSLTQNENMSKQLELQFRKEMASEFFQGMESDSECLWKLPSNKCRDDYDSERQEEAETDLISKSEKIIMKLKKLKKKCYIAKDQESIADIDCDSGLFEMEYLPLLKRRSSCQATIDIISQYSQLWDQTRKANDIIKADKKNHTTSFKRHFNTQPIIIEEDNYIDTSYQLDTVNQSEKSSNSSEYEDDIISNRMKASLNISPSHNNKVTACLQKIEDFDFNIFELNELLDRNTIHSMAYQVFVQELSFCNMLFKEHEFNNFMKCLTEGYDRNVPYHNDLHAGDVFQTTFVILKNGNFENTMYLKKLDIFSVLLAAICHDFRHPGRNNMYQINSRTALANTYNDNSVLENYHVSEVFKMMSSKQECDILNMLEPEEFRIMRSRMIESILATDMANHARTLNNLKTKLETFDIQDGKNIEKMIFSENVHKTYENQQIVLSMCLHSADISNPCKPAAINKIWVDLVFIEYFSQGDEERQLNLPISILCDRTKTDVSKSQIGFITLIVMPTFETLMRLVPDLSLYCETMGENLRRYEAIVDQTSLKEKDNI